MSGVKRLESQSRPSRGDGRIHPTSLSGRMEDATNNVRIIFPVYPAMFTVIFCSLEANDSILYIRVVQHVV